MKFIQQTLFILGLLLIAVKLDAQISIGSGVPAKPGAILDLKQYEDDVAKAGGRTAEKGFMLPRLRLTDLNSLADIDPTNTISRPNPKQHIGLVIYNLTDNTATGGVLKEGTYMWDGEAWQRLGLRDAQGYGPWYRVDDPNLPSRHVDDDSFLEAKVVVGGRLILDDADLSVYGKTILKGETMIEGQATLGMNAKPTLGALLDVKSQQAKSTTDPNSDDNITSTKGGLLLPRVKLQGTATLKPFLTAAEETPEAQTALTGLMVYNLNGTPPLETGIYTWDGTLWLTAGFTKTAQSMTIAVQPKSFSFYETGEEIPEALEFKVNPPVHINGDVGTVTYQWYQMTGNNVHARVGTPIQGATNASYIPSLAFKTTNGSKSTLYAQNNGMTRFYCEAISGGVKLRSDIVEVVVGCGAKNNLGEWISFMCFNLGAGKNIGTASYKGITIDEQMNYQIGAFTNDDGGVSGNHAYIPGEEILWGNTFQWGRIADGHEKRTSIVANQESMTNADFANGDICNITSVQRYPITQVKQGSVSEGKFIIAPVLATANGDWNLVAAGATGVLWSATRSIINDPCAKFKIDGTYQEWWSTGVGSDACSDGRTAWKMPSAEDFGEIYKGGTLSGSYSSASANTWIRNTGTATNKNAFNEVKPDGEITTLVFPLNGYRHGGNGALRFAGEIGYLQTASQDGVNAYHMNI